MIFMCQMLCNTHLTRPNKIKSNQSSPVHHQKHWRSVNDALASCWRSLAMVGVALTTDWRRFIHWRPLTRLGDFFEHSKKIAKLDEALTTADERWRCDGNVLTLSGDVWRGIGDVSKIVGRQCIARRRQLVWKGLNSSIFRVHGISIM